MTTYHFMPMPVVRAPISTSNRFRILPTRPGLSNDSVAIEEDLEADDFSPTSTVAAFTLLPINSVAGLRDFCVQKTDLAKRRDGIESHMLKEGKALVSYPWPGYIMGTLLVYLQEKWHIDLITSDFTDLGFILTILRGRSSFLLSSAHKHTYLEYLKPAMYSESELRAYYEAFNERKNEQSGKAMLDGIASIRTNFFYVNSESFIILTIG
jgi:hypothetical protein